MAETIESNQQEVRQLHEVIEMTKQDIADSEAKYTKEYNERRRLHNEVMELKGNIRVFCRLRPHWAKNGDEVALENRGDDQVFANDSSDGKKTKCHNFKYDKVFGSKSSNEHVFSEVEPLVTSVVDGYNVCVFAYGQTGSGKTYTMMGSEENPGIIGRGLEHLFSVTNTRKECKYDFSVTMLEIYNETVRDLLSTSSTSNVLDVKQHQDGHMYCPGAVEEKVATMQDVLDFLALGGKNRAVASTNCNEQSSRSHMLLSISVSSEHMETGNKSSSTLHLIDLAGSERLSRSGVEGKQQREAQNINKSLSALGDVVMSMYQKSKHIPFRNSKLTHLLQDSLSGDSKTLMLMQASPATSDLGESLCTLRFAERVRATTIGVAKKNTEAGDFAKCREHLVQVQRELKAKTEQLEEALKSQRVLDKQSKKSSKTIEAAQEEVDRTVAKLEKEKEKLAAKQQEAVAKVKEECQAKVETQCKAHTAEVEAINTKHEEALDAELAAKQKEMEAKMAAQQKEMEARIAQLMAENSELQASAAAKPPSTPVRGVPGALEDLSNESPSVLSPADAVFSESFGAPGSSARRKSSMRKSVGGWMAFGELEGTPQKDERPATSAKREEESQADSSRPKTATPAASKSGNLTRQTAASRRMSVHQKSAGRAVRVPMKAETGVMRTGAKRVTGLGVGEKKVQPTMRF